MRCRWSLAVIGALFVLAGSTGPSAARSPDPRLSQLVRETKIPHFVDDQGKLWLRTDKRLDRDQYLRAFSDNSLELSVPAGKSSNHLRIRFRDKMYHLTAQGFGSAPYRMSGSPDVRAIISLSNDEAKQLEQALAQALKNPAGAFAFRLDGGLTRSEKGALNQWIDEHQANRRAYGGIGLGKPWPLRLGKQKGPAANANNCATWIQRAVVSQALGLPIIPHGQQLLSWLARDPNPKIKAIIVHDPKHQINAAKFNPRNFDVATQLGRLNSPLLSPSVLVKVLSMPRLWPVSKRLFSLQARVVKVMKSPVVQRTTQLVTRAREKLAGPLSSRGIGVLPRRGR